MRTQHISTLHLCIMILVQMFAEDVTSLFSTDNPILKDDVDHNI